MVYVVMIIITLFWITPTVGLLVSSFRPADDVKTSGWWTVVINPDKARFTLDNYRTVLGLPIPG
jgi:alpha-glucoside transport system permease protein